MNTKLYTFLEKKVDEYNQPSFILKDPICIPHLFSKKQDIEIAGFFAALFSWGNRAGIINKSKTLMQLMDNAPYDFCQQHSDNDLKRLLTFKHRTFNPTDLLYCIAFLKKHYEKSSSLETAFSRWMHKKDETTEQALNGFYTYFFSLDYAPARTRKHIAAPVKNSACKRLNMYLRWMVRNDNRGVDFGLWRSISPAQLLMPLDVHVARVARKFSLLKRNSTDWKAALEITSELKKMDSTDPVKYDYALFALGVLEKF